MIGVLRGRLTVLTAAPVLVALTCLGAHAQAAEAAKPQPSYAGLLVTCAEFREGTWGIYTLDDKGQPQLVVRGGMWPHYAPDRRSFMFVRGGNLWLHRMDTGANLASPFASHRCLCRWDLSWRPDGRTVHFIERSTPSETFLRSLRVCNMRVEGFGSGRAAFDFSEIVETDGDDHGFPAVSRSGTLAFCALRRHSDVGISRSHVLVQQPPGGRQRYLRITDWPDTMVETKPCWSPDGKKLAFEALDLTTGLRQVWICDVESRKLQRVLERIPGAEYEPLLTDCWLYGWQPGGDGLLVGYGKAGRVTPDMSGLILARPDGNTVLMEQGGNSFNVIDAAWSPDGQCVAWIASGSSPGQTMFLNSTIILKRLSDPKKQEQIYYTPRSVMQDFERNSALTPVSLEW